MCKCVQTILRCLKPMWEHIDYYSYYENEVRTQTLMSKKVDWKEDQKKTNSLKTSRNQDALKEFIFIMGSQG